MIELYKNVLIKDLNIVGTVVDISITASGKEIYLVESNFKGLPDDESGLFPLYDCEKEQLVENISDEEAENRLNDYRKVLADRIKQKIEKASAMLEFEYNNKNCNIHHTMKNEFFLSCDDKKIILESIDKVMNIPFWCGQSLVKIIDKIHIM